MLVHKARSKKDLKRPPNMGCYAQMPIQSYEKTVGVGVRQTQEVAAKRQVSWFRTNYDFGQ